MKAGGDLDLATLSALDGDDLWARELELCVAIEAPSAPSAEQLDRLRVLRTAARLRLQLYDAALADAHLLCGAGDRRVACAAALAGLQRYAEARAELASLGGEGGPLAQHAGGSGDGADLAEHLGRLEAQAAGAYGPEDLLVGTGCSSPPLFPPLAEFVGHVEVAELAAAGGARRGLRATRAAKPGELLACSFALVRTGSTGLRHTGVRSPASLQAAVSAYRHAMEISPHAARILGGALSSGTAAEAVPLEWLFWRGAPGAVAAATAMAAATSTATAPSDEILLGVCGTNSFTESGIESVYPAVSLVNHSCVPSCSLLKVGNAHFLRACRPLSAGAEVTIAYFDTLRPLKEREQRCRSWGFVCDCPRCEVERAVPLRELRLSLCLLPQMACLPVVAGPELCGESAALEELEEAVRRHFGDEARGHWLRAGFLGIYRSRAEGGGREEQEAFVRLLEATVPGSFLHCRQVTALWAAHNGWGPVASPGGRASEDEHRAWQWCVDAHRLRYGSLPSRELTRVMQETLRSVESHRDEFCRAAHQAGQG